MVKSIAKKIVATGIIFGSLVFTSQAAFAATIVDTGYNDDYYVAQQMQYGDIAMGKINSASDKDWYYIQTGPNDGGRTMTVLLQNPNNFHYIFVVNKNDAEPVTVTDLNPGNNNEWVSFTVEANTRYNFGVFKSSSAAFDPNALYFLSPAIF
ncbi:hypothetical protein SAMN02799630_00556 [Paenibacillus sp. UNCCL117]|uniref:hypothetical protein n=1 Tax=unclassified Paenibacillus TaxID=185978 RepID=UPI0008826EE6|nr:MULTISPECIES: hypothetical protein [unclassified Paenibacillus]SDC10966.1 hypothetical protein SAMN04488602_101356 [Paenibacillus sp. cl123]SFW16482.1 hypothetical protein SAMN02799630_00556 [Paenibacillus sp. UNCCL117]